MFLYSRIHQSYISFKQFLLQSSAFNSFFFHLNMLIIIYSFEYIDIFLVKFQQLKYQVIVYFINIVLTLNTKKINGEKVVQTRKKVTLHYLKNDFSKDIIIIFANIYSSQENLLGKLKLNIFLLAFLNLILFFKVRNINQNYFILIRQNTINIIEIILIVTFELNFVACLWIKLSIQENFNDQTYLNYFHLAIKSILSLSTQYNPTTQLQYILDIISQIIGSLTFIYICHTFLKFNSNSLDSINNIKEILPFHLDSKQLSFRQRLKIRHIYQTQLQINNSQKELKLSTNFSSEIQNQIYLDVLLRSNFIKDIFPLQVIKKFCSFIQEKTIPKNAVILQRGNDSNQLIFLIKGKVKFETNFQINVSCLNQYEFISQTPQSVTLLALDQCQIATIQFDHFISIIQNLPEYEKYFMWQNKLKMNPKMKTIYKYCFLCQSSGHDLINCKNVFFMKDLENIISKLRINIQNLRAYQERNCQKSNAKVRQELISNVAIIYAKNKGMHQFDLDQEYKQKLLGNYQQSQDLFEEDEYQQSSYNSRKSRSRRKSREPSQTQYIKATTSPLMKISVQESESQNIDLSKNQNAQFINDSIIVTGSPGRHQYRIKKPLSVIEQGKRMSNQKRGTEKRISAQSQNQSQQIHSTSIIQSQQNVLSSLLQYQVPSVSTNERMQSVKRFSSQYNNQLSSLQRISETIPQVYN